jgi:hypothetical protein
MSSLESVNCGRMLEYVNLRPCKGTSLRFSYWIISLKLSICGSGLGISEVSSHFLSKLKSPKTIQDKSLIVRMMRSSPKKSLRRLSFNGLYTLVSMNSNHMLRRKIIMVVCVSTNLYEEDKFDFHVMSILP